MTGATDGDVERALAAIGATPIKYHSFGVASVRPPGARPVSPPGPFSPAGMSPAVGPIDTAHPVSPHAVSAVFPLLGRALPEAFHVDVEPEWPVVAAGPTHVGLIHGATTAPFPPPVVAPGAPVPTATSTAAGHFSPFTLPAWLEPASASVPYSADTGAISPASTIQPMQGGFFEAVPPAAATPPRPAEPLAPAGEPGAYTLPPWLEPLPQTGRHEPNRPPAVPPPSFSPFNDIDSTIRHKPVSVPGTFPAWLEPLPPASPGLAPVESDKLSFPSPVAAPTPVISSAPVAAPTPVAAPAPVIAPAPVAPPAPVALATPAAAVPEPVGQPLATEPPMFREPPMFQTPAFPTVMPVATPQHSPAYVQQPAAPLDRAAAPSPTGDRSPATSGRTALSDLFRTLGARPVPPHARPPAGGGTPEDRTSSF